MTCEVRSRRTTAAEANEARAKVIRLQERIRSVPPECLARSEELHGELRAAVAEADETVERYVADNPGRRPFRRPWRGRVQRTGQRRS